MSIIAVMLRYWTSSVSSSSLRLNAKTFLRASRREEVFTDPRDRVTSGNMTLPLASWRTVSMVLVDELVRHVWVGQEDDLVLVGVGVSPCACTRPASSRPMLRFPASLGTVGSRPGRLVLSTPP